jgi:hypothetical protein
MADIDKIKKKLAKLLRLGENDAASEGEIQNALDMATQLMAKHQLTRDDIDTSSVDPVANVVFGRHFAFCKGANASTWELVLVNFVKSFIGSVDAYSGGKLPVRRGGIAELGKNGEVRHAATICFFGADDDARCASEMFEELRDASATMAIVRWGGWARGDGFAYALGFARGLSTAHDLVKRKLLSSDDATHALMVRSDSTALAIVDGATQWLATTHGIRLRTTGRRRVSGSHRASDAYSEGYDDGQRYDATRPSAKPKLK